VDSFGKDQ
jgi:hypothetical protein